MKNKTIGYLVVISSIGLIIISPFIQNIYPFTLTIPLGVVGFFCGTLILWLGNKFKLDDNIKLEYSK